jgi:hypothetical protein
MSPSGYKEKFIGTSMEKKLLEKKDPGPKGPTALALLTALIPGAFSTAYHQRKHDLA